MTLADDSNPDRDLKVQLYSWIRLTRGCLRTGRRPDARFGIEIEASLSPQGCQRNEPACGQPEKMVDVDIRNRHEQVSG